MPISNVAMQEQSEGHVNKGVGVRQPGSSQVSFEIMASDLARAALPAEGVTVQVIPFTSDGSQLAHSSLTGKPLGIHSPSGSGFLAN